MRAVLDRLDERMREGLIKPTGRTGQGISAVLTVLAFNFVGDGLRDALDPRLKK